MSKYNYDSLLLAYENFPGTLLEFASEHGLTYKQADSAVARARKLRNGTDGATTNKRGSMYPRVELSAAVFDIEVTSFDSTGWSGHLVCTSIMPLSSDIPYTVAIRFEDNRDDRRLLQETIQELSKYDILIGHNIKGFDLNWLGSRAMFHGFPLLPKWLTYDTYQVSKSMAIKVESKSLGALCSYFGLQGTKTSIFKTDWSAVDSPYKQEFDDALEEVMYHCEQDVEMNRRLFDVLYSYDYNLSLKRTKW